MRPRDWFSVGVRLFGVWVFYRGFSSALDIGAFQSRIGQSYAMASQGGITPGMGAPLLWYPVGYFLLAIYLLFGAEHLTRWVFKERRRSTEADRLRELAFKEAGRAARSDSATE
jgi:hypothetical protein